MGILRKMIETAKVTAEVASNGLRKFGYQSYDKAKKASETVADEITPAAVKKAKAASKIVSETVAPAAIKSASEVYERFKSDYGPETAKAFKTAYDKFAKANCEMRHARQSTIPQSLNKVVLTMLLIAFTSVVTACSGVPLIPGI